MQTWREFEDAEASYEPRPLGAKRVYREHCPRCQRGISQPKLLARPHWREDGPRICSTCIKWEATWSHVEQERTDFLEHLKERG
jgi:hypothetical protein